MYTPEKNIIDNNELKLFRELNKILKKQNSLSVASGYFNLGGFALVKDCLKNLDYFRLLLGKTPSFEEKYTSHDLFDKYSNRVKEDIETIEFNRKNDDMADELINFLKQDNVEVKLYKDSFLHGKAYIFDNIAILGSSNFTYSGLGGTTNTGFNTELNSVKQYTEAQYLKNQWFEKLWNFESNEEFKRELIEILEKSKLGNKTTPFEVYIKALYELERESIEYRIDQDFDNESKVDLTKFQEDAVKRVYSRLNRYNGVIVADSVGLGKTWIAKKVIEEYGYFQREGFMVVCPAQLRDNMWVKELRRLGLSDYIISQEKLSHEADNLEELIDNTGRNPEDIKLIVVDESHNFRNPLANRWEALFSLIEKCTTQNNIPKLLFLTATPINNSIWDLYHQIMLITRNDRSAFMKDNILDLKDYFKDIEKSGDVTRLDNLLNQIAIRRTRQYIKTNYPEAKIGDEKITFPKRKLKELKYRLNDTYRGLYEEISKKIEDDLNMAYYNLEAEYKDDDIDELQKGRMQGLSGIFKTILLKRLESSVEAFRISVARQINFLKLFKKSFFEENLLFTKTFYNKYIGSENDSLDNFKISDYEDIKNVIHSSGEEIEEVDLENYSFDNLKKDLNEDIDIFRKMYNDTKVITDKEDTKLNKFKEKLLELKTKDGHKIVVFSYFTDTLNYIYESIIQDKNFIDKLDSNIAKIDGNTPSAKRDKLVSKFMEESVSDEKEIDIIFSTDVLSEGQNLQKAKYLINYDLHWNPTRMIQRAGRIDRIGSDFNEIEIYNFFPEDELETLLKLVKRLQNKIDDINDSIGLDASVLGETVNPKVFGTLRIMKDGTEQEKDDLLNELEEDNFGGSEKFWLPLKEFIDKNALQQLRNLPDGIKSGLKREGFSGVFFAFRYQTDDKYKDYHYWLLYDLNTQKWLENKGKIINYIKCEENTPRKFNEQIDIYNFYDIAKNRIRSKFEEAQSIGTFTREKGHKFLREMMAELQYFYDEYKYRYEDEKTLDEIKILLNKIDRINFTKKRLKNIRNLWREYKNEEIELNRFIDKLLDYFKNKKILSFTEREEFNIEKLKLVCVDVID